MNIDRYDHWSYWFMHKYAVHALKGYWSCKKTVDHSYEQALIMHDNVHIHVTMNIIVTPTLVVILPVATLHDWVLLTLPSWHSQ